MSLFDIVSGVMGRPDPSAQLAAQFDPRMQTAQALAGQQGGPQAGQGGPPGGGGAPGAPPTGAPPAGPQGAVSQAPPQPQAYQSPPDLMQAYMTLMQRSRAEDQFNRGLALMAASAYPGRRPDIIMNSIPQAQNPASLVDNLMKMQQWSFQQNLLQQQVKNYNDMLGNPEKYASMLNMEPEQFKTLMGALGPSGAGEMFAKVLESQAGVGNTAWAAQRRAEKAYDDQGKPLPWARGDPTSYDAWVKANTAQGVAETTQIAKDKGEGVTEFAGANQDLTETENLLKWLKDHPDATTAAIHGVATTGRPGQFRQWLGSMGLPGGESSEVATAANNLAQLQGKLYGGSWKGRGGRLSQLEAGKIAEGFSRLTDPSFPEEAITQQINDLYDRTIKAKGNAYGIAGQATPSLYWNAMDDQFKQGGRMFNGATLLKDDGGTAPAAVPGSGGKMLTYNPKTGMLE